ncbi:HAD family hydrolase [Paragemmobacter ruber]|uniref:HAD-IA family hydrolase n=1 Tax=Paragemmobacter ruber TaxID=1985673 RepID=A0ABW9Y9F8_9RHOB|nr:HAD family phosphatase [Rhodobacter ruber]NBE09240.1 HAD-IA family hydrolase [Rhodobacter ruber]
MIPEAVVFDIGNVLLEWQPERFYDREIGAARRARLFAEVDLVGMNEGVDLGAPFAASVEALAVAHPDWAPEIRMWRERWFEIAHPPIEGSIRLLRALRAKGVPVLALTNFGVETFDAAVARLPFLAEFDRAWVSGRMGVMKPDPAIYAALEAESGVAPGRLIFTDDRAENIAAAAARGWQTHLFEGWEGWAARLVAVGLLDKGEAGL